MSSRLALYSTAFLAATTLASQSAIVELWDFEDGPSNDYWFTDTQAPRSEANGSNGSTGQNGTLARGWDEVSGPQFDTDRVNPNGGSFSMDTVDNGGDAYITEGALHNWTSPNWTIQFHVFIDTVDGWETFIGRDGSNFADAESDFYLQRKGIDANELRLNYRDADGTDHILDGASTIPLGQWVGIAAVGNTTAGTLSVYLDLGSGYVLDGQTTGLTEDVGIFSSANAWTIGRGWYGGSLVDHVDGSFDNVQIDDTALSISQLTPVVPEPSVALLGGLSMLGLLRRRR